MTARRQARGQAAAIISRAQDGAEQLLGAADLGDDAVGRVAQSIVSAAEAAAEAARGSGPSQRSPVSQQPARRSRRSRPRNPFRPVPRPRAQDAGTEPTSGDKNSS